MIDERPRHLHLASLIVSTIRGARNFVAGGIALVVLAAQGRVLPALLGLLAIFAASLVLPALRWWRFTYRIENNALLIESGVLHRLRRSVPLARIQDISIEQGVIARVFRFATVRVETGGGEVDEVVLDGVGLAEAERLRSLLVSGRAAVPEGTTTIPAVEPVFVMGLGRVFLHGLLSFSLLLWVGVAVDLARRVANWFELDPVQVIHDAAPRVTLVFGAAALVLVVVLAAAAGMIRALLRDYGFALTHADGRFRCTRGLAPRRETVIVDRRIQLALIRRKLVARWFGWCAVDFQTLGGSDGPSGRQEAAPLARADEAARVIAAAGLPQFAGPELVGVDPRHGVRLAIRRGVMLVAVTAVLAWFEPLALLLLAGLVPLAWLALLAPRFHRRAIAQGALHVARGTLARVEWIVPLGAVQTVMLRRGPIQRWLGLVTLAPDTAGAGGTQRPTIEDLQLADGQALAATLVGRNYFAGA